MADSDPSREFDETMSKARALAVSALCHVGAIVLFASLTLVEGLGLFYLAAVGLAAVLLAWEQSLVTPRDLTRLNTAFFTLNGWVSILIFLGGFVDLLLVK